MNEHRQPYENGHREHPFRNVRTTLNLKKIIVVILALVVMVELAPLFIRLLALSGRIFPVLLLVPVLIFFMLVRE